MKNFTKSILLSIGLLVLSCSWIFQDTQILKAEWLIGTWENKTSRGSTFETWRKTGQNQLNGMSYQIREKDTLVFETIQLMQESNGLSFTPTVRDQNDQQPVKFSLKSLTDSEMVFENQTHDFPQVIAYRRINKDSLVAEISGIKEGQWRGSRFPMKRIR